MTRVPLFLLLFLSFSVLAQTPRNEVSISAGWSDFADSGGARAAGVSYTRFWAPWLSTQAGAIFAGEQITPTYGAQSFTDMHVTVQAHAFRNARVSPWVGFGGAYVNFEADYIDESRFTTIAGAGVDVKLTRSLALGVQGHHSQFTIDPRARFPFDISPMTVSVAARWRY